MNIEELISKGKELSKTIEEIDWTEAPPPDNRYRSNKKDEYQNWSSSAKMFIRNSDSEEYNEIKKVFEKINPENHGIILASLKAIQNFPKESSKDTIVEKEKNAPVVNVFQNQQTSVTINLIIGALENELTNDQRKEIQTIIDDKELEPEKKKSKIVETLKKFGSDVASNVLANILTNPSFLGF